MVRGLVAAGALIAEAMQPQPEAPPDWRRAGFALSPAQAEAAGALRARIAREFSVSLVDGVPGSGKTEVYFEAMAAALADDLQVLVLLPEIALGAQWRARFREQFGAPPREWHSDLGRLERRRTWRAVAEGETCVVVGARSALFLPFRKLGLIVVDEEHDASFKQEDGVTYHARDMAVVRARLGEIPAILVSATPSLETVVNARAGRYAELSLPDRAGGGRAPLVEVIDLRGDRPPKGRFVSPSLRGALVETLAAGKQALLFLNRRGYAPLTLCRTCGHRIRCTSCTAWLVEHRLVGRLQCHYCGFTARLPSACPACGAQDSLAACGPGVERLADEMAALAPDARTAVATSDTLRGPADAADLVGRIETRGRYHHRHADHRQGLSLPAAHAGGRRRRRSRAFGRRSARIRADLSVVVSGRRPRGAGGGRPGAAADVLAGASGDHRARLRRPRALSFRSRRRNGDPRACRRSAGWQR